MTEENKRQRMEVLADELPVLRAMLRISQTDICREVGISRQTFSLIETKKQTMTWVTYMALLAFFGGHRKTRVLLVQLGLIVENSE